MSNEAVRQAHMSYNPSGAAPVTSATGQFTDPLFESAEGGSLGYVDCADFKVMADGLRKRLIADQDVCLYIEFDDGAHVAPLLSIEVVEGPPCTITFTVARTSIQGNGKNFENIPVNPGTTTYTLTNQEDEFYSISSNTDFPGSVVTGLYVDAFERQ